MPSKLEKREDRIFSQNRSAFTLSNLVELCNGFMKTTLLLTLHLSAFTKTTGTISKNKRFQMTLKGLSRFCAKLEPASSNNK